MLPALTIHTTRRAITLRWHAGYAIVEGQEGTPELLRTLQPKALLPFQNNSVDYQGALTTVLTKKGSSMPQDVQRWLQQQGMQDIQVLGPQKFGQPLDVALERVPMPA